LGFLLRYPVFHLFVLPRELVFKNKNLHLKWFENLPKHGELGSTRKDLSNASSSWEKHHKSDWINSSILGVIKLLQNWEPERGMPTEGFSHNVGLNFLAWNETMQVTILIKFLISFCNYYNLLMMNTIVSWIASMEADYIPLITSIWKPRN